MTNAAPLPRSVACPMPIMGTPAGECFIAYQRAARATQVEEGFSNPDGPPDPSLAYTRAVQCDKAVRGEDRDCRDLGMCKVAVVMGLSRAAMQPQVESQGEGPRRTYR